MINILDRFLLWRYESKLEKLNAGFDHEPATPALVAERFKLLFKLHGVETAEIPEVKSFESITLHDLNSNDNLLQKLTAEFLHKTADHFGIRIEWLRSGEPTMYQHRHWYKERLSDFFEDLKEVDFESTYDPFIVITTHEKLDVNNPEYQPFILVLRKHLGMVDEKDIYKYYMESVWDWHHPPCRLQAKALATQYYKLTRRSVTMFTSDKPTFHKIVEGYIPPNDDLSRNHKISFEEYGALDFGYFDGPYEKAEFDAVVATIKEYELDGITYKYVTKTNAENTKQSDSNRKRGRKPSEAKREIKERFMETFAKEIFREKITASKAARDFFEALPEEEKVLLFRSPKEYVELTYEEALFRAQRTLTDHYAKQK